MQTGIYEIVHVASGKRYVGSSIDIPRRWGEHLRQIRGGRHANPKLMNFFRKYGEDAFEFRVLLECSASDMLIFEQQEIDKGAYLNISPTAGNTLGREVSQKTRERHSRARAKMWQDPAYRGAQAARMSSQSSQQWKDPEYKEMMRAKISAVKREGYDNGTLVSPLVKLWEDPAYRESRTGSNNHNHNPEEFLFKHQNLGEFKGTMLEFSKIYGVERSSVTKLTKGKLKSTGGWIIEKAPG